VQKVSIKYYTCRAQYFLVLSMELLLHIILLAPRILRWLLNFWKICAPLILILSSHIWLSVSRDFLL